MLKESDPVSSVELIIVHTRMDKLKVFKIKRTLLFWYTEMRCYYYIEALTSRCSRVILFNQVHLLRLSSLSPELERINELVYRLPVSDGDVKRLQSLNRSWAAHIAHLTERFRYAHTLMRITLLQLQQNEMQ